MKTLIKLIAGLCLLLLLFALFIQFAPPKKYNHEYPEIEISDDSITLARGAYLIYGMAHCAGCHAGKEDGEALILNYLKMEMKYNHRYSNHLIES